MTIPKKVQSRLREGLKKYQPTIEGHEEPLRGDGDPDRPLPPARGRGGMTRPGVVSCLLAALLGFSEPSEAQQCEVNSECAQPLICRETYCRSECLTTLDCRDGMYCVQSQVPAHSSRDVGVCAPKDAIHASWFPNLERGVDRYGDDLKQFPIDRREPLICHEECRRTRTCVAWTYAEPGVNRAALPRCYLKNGPGQRRSNPATISGEVPSIEVRPPR